MGGNKHDEEPFKGEHTDKIAPGRIRNVRLTFCLGEHLGLGLADQFRRAVITIGDPFEEAIYPKKLNYPFPMIHVGVCEKPRFGFGGIEVF